MCWLKEGAWKDGGGASPDLKWWSRFRIDYKQRLEYHHIGHLREVVNYGFSRSKHSLQLVHGYAHVNQ